MANQLVGNSTGGLGAVPIIACLFIGAISGLTPATVAATGGIMNPSMVNHSYRKDHSTDKVYVTILV
jgi:C4-dicarboxylate transporter DctM subunit